MGRTILVCGAAVLALAACSKKADTAATGTAAPAVAEATPPAAPSRPSMKAGLWSQAMSTAGMNQTIKMCLDEAGSQKARWWSSGPPGKSDCSEERVTPHVGGGWDFHSVCQRPGGEKIVSDGSATGDFGSHYKVEVTSVTTGSEMPQANGTHKTTMEGTWQGACPAGMKPGDIEMPGGMRVNPAEMAAGAGPGGPGAMMGMKPGHTPSQAEIAKMRAQAMDMEKAMKQGETK